MQVYWGGPKPKGTFVNYIDAVACRENAIMDNVDALPVFSPLDAPELCQDENGELKHDPMYYDYLYVDVPDGNETGRFPYTVDDSTGKERCAICWPRARSRRDT